MQKHVFSNAIWNVVNGSSSAVVAVLVPPFLTRLLTPEAYGAWALALQIGTYVSLFGFGIQIAVGRFVAYSESRGDRAMRDGIVATAFWFLAAASAVGWVAISCVGLGIAYIVPNLSVDLVTETRWAVILVGLGLATNLPASIFAAVFTGIQRSDIPAKIQGLGRLVQAGGLIAAGTFHNLAILGLVYALVAIGTVTVLAIAWRKGTVAPTLAPRHITSAHGGELFSFCLSLTLWNLAMMLVTGLDLIIVGRFDYAATAFYAVSVTLATLVTGTLSSLSNALVPAAAAIPDSDDGTQLRALLQRGSRLIMAASIIAGTPLIFEGRVILSWWLGSRYADQSAMLLAILATATIIRNALLPYVTIAIGVGYQRKMIATPIAEGAITIVASLLLARAYGAQGVAIAKIVGGTCGVILLLLQNPLANRLAGLTRLDYVTNNILKPALAIIPAAAVALVLGRLPGDWMPNIVALMIVSIVILVSAWFWALDEEDRSFATQIVRKRLNVRVPQDSSI